MEHVGERLALGRTEVGPDAVGDGQQRRLGHLLERDAEQLADALFAVPDEVDRGPRRAEAAPSEIPRTVPTCRG